jgi:hypothetical protein
MMDKSQEGSFQQSQAVARNPPRHFSQSSESPAADIAKKEALECDCIPELRQLKHLDLVYRFGFQIASPQAGLANSFPQTLTNSFQK